VSRSPTCCAMDGCRSRRPSRRSRARSCARRRPYRLVFRHGDGRWRLRTYREVTRPRARVDQRGAATAGP
jgi:hypothetical protein